MKQYKKVIYISHPSSGLPENTEKIGNIINQLIKEYKDYLFLSPVHCFSYAYHAVDYITGIEMCLWLLSKCEEMWIFGDYEKSRGCNIELGYCLANNIPLKIKPPLYDPNSVKFNAQHTMDTSKPQQQDYLQFVTPTTVPDFYTLTNSQNSSIITGVQNDRK